MTATHEPVTRHFAGGVEKSDAHPMRRQPVPIRPAFRPLLPKPCKHEPSTPSTIHIHTRASLSATRKRSPPSKCDTQKRKRSSPKSACTKTPAVCVPKAETQSDSEAKVEATKKTPDSHRYGPITTTASVTLPLSIATSLAYLESKSERMVPTHQFTTTNSASFEQLPESDVNAFFVDGGYDAQLASPPLSTNSVTINPMTIAIGDDQMLAYSDSSYTTGCTSPAQSVDKMTPPYSLKNETLLPYTVDGEFDDFSEAYFRSIPGSEFVNESKKSGMSLPSCESLEVSEALKSAINHEAFESSESEFSMLDFLAPSLDLF